MIDAKLLLERLKKSLHVLQQRQAKYGLDAPASLILEIEDHQTAINLTEQLAAGQLTESSWRELQPLLVTIEERQATKPVSILNIGGVSFSDISGSTINVGNIDASVRASGDMVGGDKVTQTAEGSNIAQASHGGHAEVNTSTFDQRGQAVSGDQINAGGDVNINQAEKEPPFWKRLSRVQIILAIVLGLVVTAAAVLAVPGVSDVVYPLFTRPTFPHAKEGETLIVIATFEEVGDGQSLPHREIKNGIDQALTELNLNNPPRVEIHPAITPADDREAAEELGDQYNASMIIWGTDTNAGVTVNFLNLKDLKSPVPEVQLDEIARSQLADPPAYVKYITADLPAELTFLSLFAVGRTFYLQNDYPTAIISLERAVQVVVTTEEILPGLPEAYFRLGWLYWNSQKSAANAIKFYTKFIDLDPDDAVAYNNRGIAYHDLNQYERAIEDFDKAIKLDPDYALAYNNRGIAYHDLNQYERAIEDYDKAIKLDPNYAKAYYNRGLAYRNLDQYEQAIEDFDKAIDLDYNPLSWLYNNRGIAYHDLNQYERAIEDFDKAIKLDHNLLSWPYNNRGNAYRNLDQYERAIEDYDKAINLDPDYANAYYNRGLAYAKISDMEQAIADLEYGNQLTGRSAYPSWVYRELKDLNISLEQE